MLSPASDLPPPLGRRALPPKGGDLMGWQHLAACRDADPELHFPVGTDGPALLQIAEAKSVCARCPVSASCLDFAVSAGIPEGIWGGLTPGERRDRSRTGRRGEAAA